MRRAHSSTIPPPTPKDPDLETQWLSRKKRAQGEGLSSAPRYQMAAFLSPQTLSARFTWEQKQEQEVARRGHGGLRPEGIWPKTVVLRGPEKSREGGSQNGCHSAGDCATYFLCGGTCVSLRLILGNKFGGVSAQRSFYHNLGGSSRWTMVWVPGRLWKYFGSKANNIWGWRGCVL